MSPVVKAFQNIFSVSWPQQLFCLERREEGMHWAHTRGSPFKKMCVTHFLSCLSLSFSFLPLRRIRYNIVCRYNGGDLICQAMRQRQIRQLNLCPRILCTAKWNRIYFCLKIFKVIYWFDFFFKDWSIK